MKQVRHINLIFVFVTVLTSIVYLSFQFEKNHFPGRGEDVNIIELAYYFILGIIRLIMFHVHGELFFTALPLYFFIVRYKQLVYVNIAAIATQILCLVIATHENFKSMLAVINAHKGCWPGIAKSFLISTQQDFSNYAYYIFRFPVWWYSENSGTHGSLCVARNTEISFFFPECNLKLLILLSLLAIFIVYVIIDRSIKQIRQTGKMKE